MTEKYKSPLEYIFGNKGLLIVVVMVVTITTTMFIAFFELRRSVYESQYDLMTGFSRQREEMLQLRQDIQEIKQVTLEYSRLDKTLNDLRFQLDIMRRDLSALHSDVDDELTTLNATLKQISLDLKTSKEEQPDKP